MGKRKTVGVLTFHRCINYGSYWQARCLVEGLRAMGHDAVLLDHRSTEVTRAELRCAFQPNLPRRTERRLLGDYKKKTRSFFRAFDRLPASRRFPLDQPALAGAYDAVVVGSDEVWNFCHPWYADKPIFFGEQLRAGRLLSYAASFGNHDAERGIPDYRAEQLREFDSLSVRDGNSHRLLRSAIGQDVDLVLDPCLQFPDVIAAPRHAEPEPYALVYGHGFPHWLQAAARQWSARRGLRLISIGYANDWADEQRIAAGPTDFASLMLGAQAVITNFFHGCVFSLVGGKPFVAVRTAYRSNKLIELAAQLGIAERLVEDGLDPALFAALLGDPPGQATSDRIGAFRERSQAFLDAALA